jgi:adenylate cyclase
MSVPAPAQSLFDWLVDGAPGAPTPMAVLARVGPDLVASGVPLDRMVAFVRTLHPSVMGRRFLWMRGVAEVTAAEASWEMLQSPSFLNGPVSRFFQTAEVIRQPLTGTAPLPSADLQQLREQGFTELIGLPLKFMGGTTHAITFSTRTPGGFTAEHLAILLHVVRPLSRGARHWR